MTIKIPKIVEIINHELSFMHRYAEKSNSVFFSANFVLNAILI